MFFVSTLHTHNNLGVLDIFISIPFGSTQDSIDKISNKIP